jgi:hypothetical protein
MTASNLCRLALDPSGNDRRGEEADAGEVLMAVKVVGVDVVKVYKPLFDFFERNRYKRCTLETKGEEIPLLGRAIFGFPYDWRKDLRFAAGKLMEFIEQVKKLTAAKKVIIIAHSMGSLVALYYLTVLHGAKNVGKAILIGPPINGAPKALASLRYGKESPLPSWIPFLPSESQFRSIICNMPGMYMMLPTDMYQKFNGKSFLSINGKEVSILEAYAKLEDSQFNMKMLQEASSFHDDILHEWESEPFSELYLLLGKYQKKGKDTTISHINIIGDVNKPKEIQYTPGEGDGTVTRASDSWISLKDDIPSNNKIYFTGDYSEHLKLAQSDEVFNKILSIIRGGST